jgi:hypothetical protein
VSVYPSRSVRAKVTARAVRLAATSTGVMVLALAFAAPSSAKRIYKSVPTHATYSMTRAADGTVTAKVLFTSPNPRCLSADRWNKRRVRGGYSHDVGGGLYYGDIYANTAPNINGAPDNNGWLSPISPAGHSPYVWQAIWPGSLAVKVHVEHPGTGVAPYNYASTVSAASGGAVLGYAPPGPSGNYYKYAYNEGGNRIILKCQTTPNGGSGKEFVF